MNMDVKSLAFNTQKGSYLKNKNLDGNFILRFDKKKNDVLVQNVKLNIDRQPFYFSGKFHLEKVSPDFNLTINTYKIRLDNAVSILNDSIQSNLNAYSFNKPVDLTVELTGKTLFKYVPATRIILNLDLESVNNFGSTVFDLVKGKAAINVLFNGPIGRGDTLIEKIEGRVDITDAEVKYIPRNFRLTDLNGALKFTKNDLVVDSLSAFVGKTKLIMNGLTKNFVAILNKQQEKMDMVWAITSPGISLEDFKPFLSKNAGVKESQKGSPTSTVDKMFSDGDVSIKVETPRMQYKTFRATDVKADVVLKSTEIVLQKVSFNHANGSMSITGSIKNGANYNPVSFILKCRVWMCRYCLRHLVILGKMR